MASDRHQLRIISRAIKGDAEAFAGLCFRYADAMYRYLYFRLGSVLVAEEVCPQVFVRAWETLPSDPRQSVVPFAAWLFLVANELVVERNDKFAQAGLHPPRPPLMAWSGASGTQGRSLLHPRFLAQAVMHLDDVSQQVILLRFVIHMSHRETALVIGDTALGSGVLQYRSLLEVRELLTRKKMSENAYVSDYVGTAIFCLDRIIAGRWSPEECLEHLPQETDRLEQLLEFAVLVRDASNIRPRRSFIHDLRTQMLADFRQSSRRPIRQPLLWRWFIAVSARVPAPAVAAFLLGFILFVGLVGTTGIVTAVDNAVPGDRLYELDLQMERAYQAFLTAPDARIQYALRLTEERLAEAEALASRGDSSGLQVALVAYSVQVASLVSDGGAQESVAMSQDLDRRFSEQQQRLDKLFVTALETSSAAKSGEMPTVACDRPIEDPDVDRQWHPIGLALAAQHGVEYREVIDWVCDGHSFGEIVLGLASIDANQIPAGDILRLKAELGGWGQLWQEMQRNGVARPAANKLQQELGTSAGQQFRRLERRPYNSPFR